MLLYSTTPSHLTGHCDLGFGGRLWPQTVGVSAHEAHPPQQRLYDLLIETVVPKELCSQVEIFCLQEQWKVTKRGDEFCVWCINFVETIGNVPTSSFSLSPASRSSSATTFSTSSGRTPATSVKMTEHFQRKHEHKRLAPPHTHAVTSRACLWPHLGKFGLGFKPKWASWNLLTSAHPIWCQQEFPGLRQLKLDTNTGFALSALLISLGESISMTGGVNGISSAISDILPAASSNSSFFSTSSELSETKPAATNPRFLPRPRLLKWAFRTFKV